MSKIPQPPAEPPVQARPTRPSFGPAVNALSIVGFVVAIALVGHRFSGTTAPAPPVTIAQMATSLPQAVLRKLRTGMGRPAAPVHEVAKIVAPVMPRNQRPPPTVAPPRRPAQIAVQPEPVGAASAAQAVSSVSSGGEQMSRPPARPVEVVCTSTMVGARRETCLTARLRWANQQWRADYRAASAAKPAWSRGRS